MVPRTSPEFAYWLAESLPGFASRLEDHLTEYDGELLEHVLFADVTRYVADLADRARENWLADDASPEQWLAEAELRRFLDLLNWAMLPAGEDDPVNNLVWASFVGNAHGLPGAAGERLRKRLLDFPNLARARSSYE